MAATLSGSLRVRRCAAPDDTPGAAPETGPVRRAAARASAASDPTASRIPLALQRGRPVRAEPRRFPNRRRKTPRWPAGGGSTTQMGFRLFRAGRAPSRTTASPRSRASSSYLAHRRAEGLMCTSEVRTLGTSRPIDSGYGVAQEAIAGRACECLADASRRREPLRGLRIPARQVRLRPGVQQLRLAPLARQMRESRRRIIQHAIVSAPCRFVDELTFHAASVLLEEPIQHADVPTRFVGPS